MILTAGCLAERLSHAADCEDPLLISPLCRKELLAESGAASIDMRLGCWFLVFRQERVAMFDVYGQTADIPSEAKLTKMHYVAFGKPFILHPRSFVLAVTLEWIRLPKDLAGYVVGRSSWGRHGLIIATATGVHPGFTGCLTLELTNLGEVPIVIKPGTTICQLFLHTVDTKEGQTVDASAFTAKRQPRLGAIRLDPIADLLGREAS